ncbi:helix-turn-helix domain-containing protein [Paenibacillus polymyxa]|uniref:Helix-turn-helix domain-containing protein n=1 Tax=Paenibacillus polymyxa TaxID=1406 RepID=A0A8I1ITM8_PAEPO|nr:MULTISPECIES: helix-turn-helix domain-containing protein [Paenibacillus]KAF6573831.1 helix-turn-helix domain-containing protein [Paenibacillus sp. EKM206P]KAF6588284.1 helix-turn-helix domain-containing protein [Paenibacillus sp. EKM205P]MBM0635852.1 helix-turn-helix domain-containing protein [Paenibacillus polymyxa]MBP1309543.1 AraC-like DNA-binding protein [Paenibacillus sp. 1182]MDY8093576.1 helix-turn-helix domain-containing protein [Paenibacillus polymyxa]
MNKKADGFEGEKLYVVPPYILDKLNMNPLTKNLYITDIGCFSHARHHFRERMHGCDSHIFIYCTSGKGWIRTKDGLTIDMTERGFAYIPRDMPHAYGADDRDPWTIYWFHLKGDQMDDFIALFEPFKTYISISASDGVKLLELFHQCYDLLLNKSYSIIHLVQVSQTVRYLLSFVVSVAFRKEDSTYQSHVDKATRYMSEQLESTVSLEQLSRHVQVSKQHLNLIFKQSTGYSPVDYYLRMKIQRASQLLDLTNASIKEVSIQLGFRDPYYFSRLFKKIMGCSPLEYRNNLKG